MATKKIITISCLLLLTMVLPSCKKYLQTKSSQRLSTPSTLDDLQMMLDNYQAYLGFFMMNVGTDEYYVTKKDWLTEGEPNKKGYIWDKVIEAPMDWRIIYQGIFYANSVLFNFENIVKNTDEKSNGIKGRALFMRAFSFYQLAQQYALQYDAATASKDLGVVLRLTADFNDKSVRASVQQSYDQIIHDLTAALALLPEQSVVYKFRPGKAACYALLARCYLQMGNYNKAKENAAASLAIYNTLLDYNSVTPSKPFPFDNFNGNPEILYYFRSESALNSTAAKAKVDSTLFRSYEANDLRKVAFFRTNDSISFIYKGSYIGTNILFTGLAVDEVYLIRAECYAREGNTALALKDLNTLLEKRYKTGFFTNLTAPDAEAALRLVLLERRKELLNRGVRWADLKRLNKDPRFAITLKRNLDGEVYELPPNDLRYALPIPLDVLLYASGIQQNPR